MKVSYESSTKRTTFASIEVGDVFMLPNSCNPFIKASSCEAINVERKESNQFAGADGVIPVQATLKISLG